MNLYWKKVRMCYLEIIDYQLNSGVYYVVLKNNLNIETKQMVLIH